ncbi:hypothetical protein AQUCO_01400413v1 [Aquilegia coerulea]|uniref:5-formyltetrahydrofolate cyclo-ligase n=1 Tax=Aquilegia coerulea TaxID=218851 RepID=A0A2G5DW91_AQUCA|nr:hypothetical protein AQUCO_01400413v1 [Aquilegia coerulea]
MEANLIRISSGFSFIKSIQNHSSSSSSLSFSSSTISLSKKNKSSIFLQKQQFGKLGSSSSNKESFNETSFEVERLTLDSKARDEMAQKAEKEIKQEEEEEDSKAWKWKIRKRVWDLMEADNIAQNPRPVHHRIPNFVGAASAAKNMGGLEVFRDAKCVKVNPDSPQKQVRFLTLSEGKKLLTPQPRLRTVFMFQGFAELEYGMLRYMGAIDDTTPVVTSVHDRQLVDDIPVEKLLIHDVPVDIICTPTQVIFTNTAIPKPQGIYWDKLSPEKLSQIRILRELKSRIERETGQKLPCGPSEKLPPTAQRKPIAQRKRR